MRKLHWHCNFRILAPAWIGGDLTARHGAVSALGQDVTRPCAPVPEITRRRRCAPRDRDRGDDRDGWHPRCNHIGRT